MRIQQTIKKSAISFVLLFVWLLSHAAAQAQQPSDPLQVGLFVNPPFVMKDDGKFTGLAVELWEDVAAELGRQYDYVEFETVHDLVQATTSGNIDVAVTNLTINESRAQRVDFTQPWFDGGDRIMVATQQGSSFGKLIAGLSDAGFLRAYAWIASIIVVFRHAKLTP